MSEICKKCDFIRKKRSEPWEICKRSGKVIREDSGCDHGNPDVVFIAAQFPARRLNFEGV